jgi:biopolymer transport protein ExbD
MYFERQVRKTRPVSLVSLIDIMFFLLLFFMLSTSFVRNESLELTLPGNTPGLPTVASKVVQVYVNNEGRMYLGHQPVKERNLIDTLREVFLVNPEMNVILLSGPQVTVQQMITVMDRIYIAGGKNLSVAAWEPAPLESVTVTEPYANMRGGRGN